MSVNSPPLVVIAESNLARAGRYEETVRSLWLAARTVGNGDDALALVRRAPSPALLVANAVLPRVDGASVVRQMRASQINVPAILLGGSSQVLARLRGLGIPDTEVFSTEVDQQELRAAVARMVARSSGSTSTNDRAPAESWVQRHLQRLAIELAATFDVPIAIAQATVGGQAGVGVGVRLQSMLPVGRRFLDWPVIKQALGTRDLFVVPNIAQHPLLQDEGLPPVPAPLVGGIAVMPMIDGTGQIVGAAALLDVQPLMLTAHQLQSFSAHVRAVTAELDGALAAKVAEHQLKFFRHELEQRQADASTRIAALSEVVVKDVLTGLLNRRGGSEALVREAARVDRGGSRLSVALFDVDQFKRINDQNGHAVGDQVLAEVGRVIARLQRASDVAIRWGGDEFLVLLPNIDAEGARVFAERVRSALERVQLPNVWGVTISVGTTEMIAGESIQDTFARADQLLYKAKGAAPNPDR
jgi:diguanylate cyclase (GGDEF)-like protein